MNRRGFLGVVLAAGVAPAIIRSGILMPVRQIATLDNGLITAFEQTITINQMRGSFTNFANLTLMQKRIWSQAVVDECKKSRHLSDFLDLASDNDSPIIPA